MAETFVIETSLNKCSKIKFTKDINIMLLKHLVPGKTFGAIAAVPAIVATTDVSIFGPAVHKCTIKILMKETD